MFLPINGCKLYVDDVGPRDARAILALHSPGGNGDSRGLKSVFKPFSDKYRVVFFDLRGCGASEEVGVPSFEQLSADIEELRKYLGLGRVVLTGGSGGGFLALECAARYPDSLDALILRGTGPVATNVEHIKRHVRQRQIKVDWDRLERYWTGHCEDNEDLRQALLEIGSLYAGSNKSNPVLPNARDTKTSWHYRTHNYAMQEQVSWSMKSRLHDIKVPTLIIHGSEDWVVPLSHAEMLRDGIPNARLEVFEGCGHSPQLEEKSRFEALVRDFLVASHL